MSRRIAWLAAIASLALLGAAPALAWFDRGRPRTALACVAALGIASLLVAGSRRAHLPAEVIAVLLLPFVAAWGFGEGLGFFAHVGNWDALCHALAGASLGVMTAGLSAGARRGWTLLWRALAAALVIGLLWELGEWTSDRLLGTTTRGSAADTRSDVFFDGLGGMVGGLAVIAARRFLPLRERTRLLGGLIHLGPRLAPGAARYARAWRLSAAAAASRTRPRRSAGSRSSASPASDRTNDTR